MKGGEDLEENKYLQLKISRLFPAVSHLVSNLNSHIIQWEFIARVLQILASGFLNVSKVVHFRFIRILCGFWGSDSGGNEKPSQFTHLSVPESGARSEGEHNNGKQDLCLQQMMSTLQLRQLVQSKERISAHFGVQADETVDHF